MRRSVRELSYKLSYMNLRIDFGAVDICVIPVSATLELSPFT